MIRPQVTQKNVHLFIPNKVSKICSELARTENLSLNESILKFYNSSAYETLSRESPRMAGWSVGFRLAAVGVGCRPENCIEFSFCLYYTGQNGIALCAAVP
ncbi:MAG: hypothetical protein II558_06325, partial [Treponema sp.]|nr:hypothetical protein [Treponema sp.]